MPLIFTFIIKNMKSFYFSHDYNASDDVKMLFMRQDLGFEGIGIYWYLIEKLAQSNGKLPIKIIPILSQQMGVKIESIHNLINNYELFVINEDQFYSQRLLKTLEISNEQRKQLSDGGKKGMQNRWNKDKKIIL